MQTFLLRISDNLTNGRMFVTQRGYFGHGMPAVKPGDAVYVLAGGDLCYILRPVTDSATPPFELTGADYVHGLMDGEAVDAAEAWDEIKLRAQNDASQELSNSSAPDPELGKDGWHHIYLR